VRVGIDLSGNKGSKTFIGAAFRACNNDEIGSTPLDFVDPELYLRSRECMIPIMLFQTANDFYSENALIRGEFDNMA
jgi:hypothetical protein